MALLQVQFFSKALVEASTVDVILPEPEVGIGVEARGTDAPPKVLYLLHGYSDDHSIWQRRTSVERYAASYNLAVVMPAVRHSFYTNEAQGERYWDYVAEELPRAMHRFFRLSEAPEDTFVAGLSMGGYGAMKLALTHPERFAAAASFSGCVDICDMGHRTAESVANMARIFGDVDAMPGSEHDLFHLLEKNAGVERKPRLYVSCGTADFLYHMQAPFVEKARSTGWDVTYSTIPDAVHEWGLWDDQIRRTIPWMLGEKA